MSRTTISVRRDTREMLKRYGRKGEDYDRILRRLMELHEEANLEAYLEEQGWRAEEDRFTSLEPYERNRGRR